MKMKTGVFKEKYRYIKVGKGSKNAVFFPGSEDLIISEPKMAWFFGPRFMKLFPKDYSLLILSYDPKISEGTTPFDIADDFAEIIREELGSAVIMGLSFGGMVALCFASRYPELTDALIVVSSSHHAHERTLDFGVKLMQMMHDKKISDAMIEFLNLFKRKIYRLGLKLGLALVWLIFKKMMNPPEMLLNAYLGAQKLQVKGKKVVSLISSPTLILGGSDDQIFPLESFNKTAELIKDAKLEIFEGETHTMMIERPNPCKKKIKQFLESLA
ncbi:MAG: alpha/beta fold hydrolase [Candidatus Hodarchaeota archaeon]